MKRVGVTGAAGFIGSHLCERLLAEDVEVVAIDDLSYGSIANVAPFLDQPGFRFEVLDCTNRRELRTAFDGCDAIAHLAAKKIPRFGGVLSTLEVNVGGVNAAAAVAMALDADLVFTSTSDVYGDGTPPYNEDGEIVLGPPTSKRWSYAVSKLYDEHHLLALVRRARAADDDPSPLQRLRPAQPPELVGRADGHLRRGAPERRADRDPR